MKYRYCAYTDPQINKRTKGAPIRLGPRLLELAIPSRANCDRAPDARRIPKQENSRSGDTVANLSHPTYRARLILPTRYGSTLNPPPIPSKSRLLREG